ncbi:TPA: DNA recombination protein RmuC [Candidatus Galligastranaerophilus intestinavium]|uniref:DNA recombination protein RmuC n=1 Tax=Candidatus Galligastranaerophilus intestinavium TaxID=2840836 RepID=A0A9D1FHW6_9BACT|nr:DNA recombination protein RmuC [Candidatus Galligastranaerophilus intestinavium]
MYIFLALILGAALGFVFSKLKFDVLKAKLQSEIDTLKNSQNTSENLCEKIKSEFVNLANSAILEKQQMLEEQNLKKLDTQLNPLKERILEFQKKVEEFNVSGVKNTNIIQEQIKSLTNENNQIRMQAENLTRALKENSKSRGLFGEMILENILKSSGMENKTENPERGTYITQKGFRSNNDPNGTKITPDAVVYYPDDDKNIVIDSKMSFVDFMNFIETDDENEKQISLKHFYKSIEERINELSGKYDNLEGLATPDFTLMFVPIESCINYIYSNIKLIEEAYKKRVVIVGPASLIATLRVIKYSWAQKNQEKNVREILKLADNLYSKVATLIGHLEKLQTNFTTVQKTFGQIFSTLSGRGGLISQTEKLKDFGISPSSSIDKKYIESQDGELIDSAL